MYNNKYIIFIFILCLSLFVACEEVVQLDLTEGKKRLVIDGRIEKIIGNVNNHHKIQLSTTGPYIGTINRPGVKDAIVTVSDDSGNAILFHESTEITGLYETNQLNTEIGHTYRLNVIYNSETYIAEETLYSVPPIDTIYQVYIKANQFDDAGIRVKINLRDPSNIKNYYLWEQLKDGESQIKPDPGNKFNIIAEDKFFNGQQIIGYTPNDEAVFTAGQTALVRQISLSPFAYDYYYLILEQTSFNDIFDPPPATIRGNIKNTTNPDNYALGYFRVSEVSEAGLVIE
jgi:uncharacterized protein DUF4249